MAMGPDVDVQVQGEVKRVRGGEKIYRFAKTDMQLHYSLDLTLY